MYAKIGFFLLLMGTVFGSSSQAFFKHLLCNRVLCKASVITAAHCLQGQEAKKHPNCLMAVNKSRLCKSPKARKILGASSYSVCVQEMETFCTLFAKDKGECLQGTLKGQSRLHETRYRRYT